MISSTAKRAKKEGERARAATRMAACDGEAKGAEPVTTLLLNINFELHLSPDCVLMVSKKQGI